MTKPFRRIFIGSAWPYANGPLHLGHVAALLPADVLARYFRLRGDAVAFVSGSDAHGTPITVRADQEGVSPAVIAERYHRVIAQTFTRLGFSFDKYTITTTPRHAELAQELFLKLKDAELVAEHDQELTYCEQDKRFLPDRYVEGTCPVCGFDKARGDQCDQCKSLLDPLKLLEARCTLCRSTPVRKTSKHFFLQLPKFQKQLEQFVRGGSAAGWRDNAVAFSDQYLKQGLQERAITRDIEWGVAVPVPGYEHKRLYVWFEAVCGYYTAHRQLVEQDGQPDAWRPFWDPAAAGTEVRHYYVHGKDNIPFHTVIWPAILLGARLRLPSIIVSSEYLTLEGKKFSTSRNWAVWADDVLERYQPDALRYYLLANGPESRDADFSWDAFVAKTNNELVATYGNFVQRLTTFARAHFADGLPDVTIVSEDRAIVERFHALYVQIGEQIEAAAFKAALATLFEALKHANAWLDQRAPWKAIKQDRAAAASTVAAGLELVVNVANLTAPFLPFQAARLADAFGFNLSWQWQNRPARVPALSSLFTKLDPTTAAQERAKLGAA